MRQAKGVRGKCDSLATDLVKRRDNWKCRRCGKQGATGDRNIQWAHLISRRFPRTRTQLDAAVTLCGGCHRLVDENWNLKEDLVVRTIGHLRYQELWELAQSTKGQRFDWDAEYDRLCLLHDEALGR